MSNDARSQPAGGPGDSGGPGGPRRGRFASERLDRLRRMLSGYVERDVLPGLVALVARHGEVHVFTAGALAAGGPAPMRRDTIFRIASLTKPVTAVGAMQLVEEATLRLDDPVDRWLPELADRRVLRAVDGPLADTVPAARPISVRDLLTLRLGLGAVMISPSAYPIQHAMDAAQVAPSPDQPTIPPDEYLRRCGALPLAYQPGEVWMYHTGIDLLGVLLARASGRPLGDLLRERIFEPLGMRDTGFCVPEADVDRLATAYRPDPERGGLAVYDAAAGGRFTRPPVFEAGGSGLVSTVDDYFVFLQMLLDGGSHGGRRILSRPSVELMTTDQLTPGQKAASDFVPGFWDAHGWGLGLAVDTRRDDLSTVPGRFGWDGGYGTSGYADPKEGLVGVLLTQRMMDSAAGTEVARDFWTMAYAAIDD